MLAKSVLRAFCFFVVLGVSAQTATADESYVGSATCAGCHSKVTDDWKGSHHAQAWTPVSPDTVLADFDDTEFTHDGMTARFRIDPDGTFFVTVTEKDGVTMDYPVHSVVGIEPLQQYILETEPGRLQSFDVVWDTERGNWFHLYPNQDLPPDDGLHWTGPYKNWNARCAECHATGFNKNYNPTTRSYASTQAEIGVGCEACHGPGRAHLEWTKLPANTPPPENYGFTVDFSDREIAIQQCATCHSRREAHFDGNPLPGTPFHDAYRLSPLRPGLYEADGQILDEVFVYGSFLQSKMYEQGVGCLDCHDAHSATRVVEGNAVCAQCHNPAGNPRFPTLVAADYDDPEHHFHPMGTPAAQCKNCHMVERVYMGNDWRTDHSFRIPRPDLSKETNAPDACTACHTERDADWAAAQLEEWYPNSKNRGAHYGQVLARGVANPVLASDDLATLAEDPSQPGIVRATAMWLLEQAERPEIATRLEPLLADKDPFVREAAVGVQALAPPQDRLVRLLPALRDQVRSVRIAAARTLIDVPIAHLPDAIAADMEGAMQDWRSAIANRLDFPETNMQLAGISLVNRDFERADRAFREAVALDPQQVPAWTMIARIRAALGASPDQIGAVLDAALAANPGNFDLMMMKSELEGSAAPDGLLPPSQN